jgi:hypothetical protein
MSLRTLASPAHEYMGLTRTWTPRSFPLHSELIGAIVGRLTSFSLTWLRQHAQITAKLHEAAKARRRPLFSEFITEASRLYGDALTHEKDDVTDLVSLYALIANMRLATSIDVVNTA